MPKSKSTVAELERVQREREAVQAQQNALNALERELRQRLAAERAQVIVDAFAAANVGEIDKREASRLARAIARLGIAQVLAIIDKPSTQKDLGAGASSGSGKSPSDPGSSGKSADQTPASNDLAEHDSGASQVELAA